MKFAIACVASALLFALGASSAACNSRPATVPSDTPTSQNAGSVAPPSSTPPAYTLSIVTPPPVATPPVSPPSGSASNAKVRVVELNQEGDLPSLVRAANVRAKEEHRTLVVYVGADWCPPCKAFHEALMKGELDEKFPNMTVLMVDLDANRERVLSAGYGSKYIPFFAVPGPDGRKAKGFEVSTLKKDQAMAEIIAGLKKFM
ncbi:MAG: thioredoxin family protein [Polyangiaceae bacterium]